MCTTRCTPNAFGGQPDRVVVDPLILRLRPSGVWYAVEGTKLMLLPFSEAQDYRVWLRAANK